MAVNFEAYFESVIKDLDQSSDENKPLNFLSFYLKSFLNPN
ncbi:MAG TPA: hypothetical protein VEC93_20045 [Anaerolineae bacterium]|nr:hypothetical protein [Anaerolineae bacterium]